MDCGNSLPLWPWNDEGAVISPEGLPVLYGRYTSALPEWEPLFKSRFTPHNFFGLEGYA